MRLVGRKMRKIRSEGGMKNWCDNIFIQQYITIPMCARLEWQQESLSNNKNKAFGIGFKFFFIPGSISVIVRLQNVMGDCSLLPISSILKTLLMTNAEASKLFTPNNEGSV